MGKKEEEEIIRIAKKMDKMAQKKNGSTRIGMSVNAIRKQSTDEEVTSLAKALIKSWKKLLGGDKASDEKRKEQTTPVVSPSQGSPEAKEESSSSSNSSSKSEPTEVAPNTLINTFPRAPSTSDSIRLKCREMLANALQTGDDYIAIGADCDELGAQIEENILYMKYKNRVRSRISNLKDMKNPNLRRTVLCGSVTPERMAKMTAEEMASDELKEMRKNLTKEAVRDHQMATTGGTQTDLFTCGKCKGKSCTYTQVQTRSADEPMTTFVFCNQCGNRWKVCCLILLAQSLNPFVLRLPRSIIPNVYCLNHTVGVSTLHHCRQ
uniref:Transcription elongation factor n=1 Tax=Acanthochromis polyacanthus TaxID=80966 RepID=A0A3Q1GE67_9TELE